MVLAEHFLQVCTWISSKQRSLLTYKWSTVLTKHRKVVIGSVLLFTNSFSHQATMPIVVLMKFRGYHIVWHQLTSVDSMRLCLIHDRSAKWPQKLRVVASWSHLFRCMQRDFCVGSKSLFLSLFILSTGTVCCCWLTGDTVFTCTMRNMWSSEHINLVGER